MMALHPNFPDSPHEILNPEVRGFPADESLRETTNDKLILDDTIAAVSSSAGNSSAAIVRMSGSAAMEIGEQIFFPFSGRLADVGGFRSCDGMVRLGGDEFPEIPARVYVFRAPRSYTRQDVLEVHLPGSSIAAGMLAASMMDLGARLAGPGEFTARAFFSGRIDLSRAEATADAINASGLSQARAAAAAIGGKIQKFCASMHKELVESLALIEASIDFAEDGIHITQPAQFSGNLTWLSGKIRRMVSHADDMPDTVSVPRVVLCGKPNVGKSSLLNCLTQTDRAITSATAGATRDLLSAELDVGWASVLLQDAAGLIEQDTGAEESLLTLADNTARAAIRSADMILFVIDISEEEFDSNAQLLEMIRSDNPGCPVVILANKADICSRLDNKVKEISNLSRAEVRGVSAITGMGRDEVIAFIRQCLDLSVHRGGHALALHERQKRALIAAADSIDLADDRVSRSREIADSAELTAIDIRSAISHIGQVSGQEITEEVLGEIFSRFCVGK